MNLFRLSSFRVEAERREEEIDRSIDVGYHHTSNVQNQSQPKNVCRCIVMLFRMLKFRFMPET